MQPDRIVYLPCELFVYGVHSSTLVVPRFIQLYIEHKWTGSLPYLSREHTLVLILLNCSGQTRKCVRAASRIRRPMVYIARRKPPSSLSPIAHTLQTTYSTARRPNSPHSTAPIQQKKSNIHLYPKNGPSHPIRSNLLSPYIIGPAPS